MKAIRKSILFNPYNENAIQIYADLAYILNKDSDVIPVLERYLDFNKESTNVWSLVARAYYQLGIQLGKKSLFNKSMDALKLQNTLSTEQERAYVYNNQGLVAWKLGDPGQAQKYLNISLRKQVDTSLEYIDTLYNIQNLLISQEKIDIASKVSDEYFKHSKNKIPDKLLLQRITILEKAKRRSEG